MYVSPLRLEPPCHPTPPQNKHLYITPKPSSNPIKTEESRVRQHLLLETSLATTLALLFEFTCPSTFQTFVRTLTTLY